MLTNLFCLLCSFLTKANFAGFQDWKVLRWVSNCLSNLLKIQNWAGNTKKQIYWSEVKWRFRQILWPSQKPQTLYNLKIQIRVHSYVCSSLLLVFSSVVKSSYLSFSLCHTKLPACLPTATAACQNKHNVAKIFLNSQIY